MCKKAHKTTLKIKKVEKKTIVFLIKVLYFYEFISVILPAG